MAIADGAGAEVPLQYVKIAAACVLFGFGLQRLIRKTHPRWGGMQIGFRDLCIWSFLMASAHGAGFMLLPILLKMSALHACSRHGRSFAPSPRRCFRRVRRRLQPCLYIRWDIFW